MTRPQPHLDTWLAAARDDLAREAPPAWIAPALAARQAEHALVRRLRPVASPASGTQRFRLLGWVVPVALAAAFVGAVALVLLVDGPPSPALPRAASFLALRPLETIAAEGEPVVVATEVPRAELAAYGLPVDPARADLPVRAEFLISRRGAVLAVRFSPE